MEVARLSENDVDRDGSSPIVVAVPLDEELQARRLAPVDELPARRLSGTTLAALAVAAGVGALALGSSAFLVEVRSGSGARAEREPATGAANRAVALLARPSTERIPLAGSDGAMVLAVGARGRAVLALDGVDPAPPGESYQAWLVGPDGKVAASAGVFSGRESVVPLNSLVPPGSAIGITVERAGGAAAPTRTIRLVARRF